MEMAAKANEEREKIKETAQGWVKITDISILYILRMLILNFPKTI